MTSLCGGLAVLRGLLCGSLAVACRALGRSQLWWGDRWVSCAEWLERRI